MDLKPVILWPSDLGVEHVICASLAPPPRTPGVFVALHDDGTIAEVTVQMPTAVPYNVSSASLKIGRGGDVLASSGDIVVHSSGIEHQNMWDDHSAPTPFDGNFSLGDWVLEMLLRLLADADEANAAAKDWWHRERSGVFQLTYAPQKLKALATSGFTLSFIQLSPVPPLLCVSEATVVERSEVLQTISAGQPNEVFVVLYDDVANIRILDELRNALHEQGLKRAVVGVAGGARAWLLHTGRGAAMLPPPPPPPRG